MSVLARRKGSTVAVNVFLFLIKEVGSQMVLSVASQKIVAMKMHNELQSLQHIKTQKGLFSGGIIYGNQ